MVQLHTERLAEAIAAFVGQARQNLRIAVCWLTHPDLYQALVQCCRNGVQVELFLNFDQLNFSPEGLNFEALLCEGAQVWAFEGPGLLHHKCAIADRSRVLTGSCNWTRSLHHDHVTVFDDGVLAAQFEQMADALRARCRPLKELLHTPPRNISLQQLYRPVGWSALEFRRQIVHGARVWIVVFAHHDAALWEHSVRTQQYFLDGKPVLKAFWQHCPHWDAPLFRQWATDTGARLSQKMRRYCLRMQVGDVLVAVGPDGIPKGIGMVGAGPEPAEKQHNAVRFVPWQRLKTTICPDALLLPSGNNTLWQYRGSGLQLVDRLLAFSL